VDASESDLEEWGNQIRYRIESLQDHLVAGKTDVTSKKIVVKLEGPCMPNLSLVDLPGLRENDPDGCPGIKDKIEEMVTKQIQNANSVILAVSPGIVEYALWKGISLAKKTDPMMERTVGVVTKVDLLYSEPCPEAYDELKDMLRPRIKKQSESQAVTYYAAYNPKDGNEVPPDMRARIAADFGDEKVGNTALSSFLQEKLNHHLAAELPKQKEEIVRKKEQLREQLAQEIRPTWESVEELVLTFGRFVQTYMEGERPTDAIDEFDNLKTFQRDMLAMVDEFNKTNTAARVYGKDEVQDSLLHLPTDEVLHRVKDNTGSDLSFYRKHGTHAERNDLLIAHAFGEDLIRRCKNMVGEVIGHLDEVLLPKMKIFYETVGNIQVEVIVDGEEHKMKITDFPCLWKSISDACLSQVQGLCDKMKNQGLKATPATTKDVIETFMHVDELKETLTQYVYELIGGKKIKKPEQIPEGECSEKHDRFIGVGTWANKFVKVGKYRVAGCTEENPEYTNCLLVYKSRQDYMENKPPRGSSIFDMKGYTIPAHERGSFASTFSGTWYTLTCVAPKGSSSQYQKQEFCWSSKSERDKFFDAFTNMAAGREWNQEEGMEAEPEPEPENGDDEDDAADESRLNDAYLNERLKVEPNAGPDHALSSPAFSQYAKEVLSNPQHPQLTSDERIENECRAEAFRVWALKHLMITVKSKIEELGNHMRTKFLNTNGKGAPFSGFAIFRKFKLWEKMEKFAGENAMRKQNGIQAGMKRSEPGPVELLRRREGGVEQRELKELQLGKLEEILELFDSHGIQ
jgi:hypothetical protein